MPKRKSVKKTKAKQAKLLFDLSLDVGGEHYRASGNTPLECLDKIEPDKFKLNTFGIYKLTGMGKKSEVKKTPFEIRRILFNKTAKEIMAHKLVMFLK